MVNDSLRLYCKKLIATWMIRLGKLRYVAYQPDELNIMLSEHFPSQFLIDVPVGKGTLSILEGEVSIEQQDDDIEVQLFCSLDIEAVATPLYRAHILIRLTALPRYHKQTKSVYVDKLGLADIRLINDEYALLNDSRNLLDLVLPKRVQDLLAGTFKSALGIVTAGSSDLASDYLHLYLSGSKQRVLDYHKPQIEELIASLKHDPEYRYQLDPADWQEALFCQYGQQVSVEQGELRFKF